MDIRTSLELKEFNHITFEKSVLLFIGCSVSGSTGTAATAAIATTATTILPLPVLLLPSGSSGSIFFCVFLLLEQNYNLYKKRNYNNYTIRQVCVLNHLVLILTNLHKGNKMHDYINMHVLMLFICKLHTSLRWDEQTYIHKPCLKMSVFLFYVANQLKDERIEFVITKGKISYDSEFRQRSFYLFHDELNRSSVVHLIDPSDSTCNFLDEHNVLAVFFCITNTLKY